MFWGPSASVPGGAPLGGFCERSMRRTEFETVPLHVVPNLWRKTAWDRFMRTASNSPLTQKYGDKTTHVSITVLFVLKLIGSPVLTQLRTGPKKCRFSIPIGKNSVPRGPHAIAWVAWCLNTLLCIQADVLICWINKTFQVSPL